MDQYHVVTQTSTPLNVRLHALLDLNLFLQKDLSKLEHISAFARKMMSPETKTVIGAIPLRRAREISATLLEKRQKMARFLAQIQIC